MDVLLHNLIECLWI